jgi:hypothetical protein
VIWMGYLSIVYVHAGVRLCECVYVDLLMGVCACVCVYTEKVFWLN